MITHETPNSSNIAKISYSEEYDTLEIEFRSGGRYRYYEVPIEVWRQALEASSIGQFVASQIKNRYKFEKI